MRLKVIPILFLLMACATALASAQSKKPLTNSDIIQMVKAGFTEQTITDAIKANDTAFDSSVQGLMALKNAGVSQNIIDAMLSAEAAKRAPSEPVGHSHAGPAAASPSLGASNVDQIFDNGWCTLKYPQNWKAYPALDAVVLSPEPQTPNYSGMSPHPPRLGAYLSVVKVSATYSDIAYKHLTTLTFQTTITAIRKRDIQQWGPDAWGTQLSYATPMMINGRSAQAAEFNRFTDERDWFIAILPVYRTNLPTMGENILCIQFFAPANQFEASRSVFEKIANSILTKEIRGQPLGAPR